ncbi:MAG: tetratricopeptide repeat protein [Ktedonobacteraceae bacterium]|nr:tetratricopeptide repeat protein [Ktedonobacteraceae bacterium]
MSKNLPLAMLLTPCIGRELEIEAAIELLKRDDVRLLTLIGMGGVGKTRLALAILHDAQHLFLDGCIPIFLDSIRHPDEVIFLLCQQLNIHVTEQQTLLETLKATLQKKQVLLLLDNFEQVISAAPLLLEILLACPYLKLLVTSRIILHVRGEHELHVLSLSLPDLSVNCTPEELSQSAAVRLFVQRVQAFQPAFQLNRSNAPAVAEICARLDGLPLSIELAAASIRLFSPQELSKRLEKRLPMLINGPGDLPLRQQTVRNTLSWSYALLDEREQRLFRFLAVFQGGFTMEAVEVVCRTGSATVSLLTSLLEKCLLQQRGPTDEILRLSMLETVREYAQECLAQDREEEEMAYRAHANYYLALAEAAELELERSRREEWYKRLEREQANIEATWRWAVEHHEMEMTLRLAGALRRFWIASGSWLREKEYCFLIHIFKEHDTLSSIPVSVWTKALATAGTLAFYHHDYERCVVFYEESLRLCRSQEDSKGAAVALNELGRIARLHGHRPEALQFLKESLAFSRKVGDQQGSAEALLHLADVLCSQFKPDEALPLVQESVALFKEIGDMRGYAASLNMLADTYELRGERERALQLSQEALVQYREIGNIWEYGSAMLEVAKFALYFCAYELAYQQAAEGLAIVREIGNREGTAWAFCLMGHARIYQGEATAGLALLEESLLCYRELGNNKGIALLLLTFARLSFERGDYATAQLQAEECLTIFIERDSRRTIVGGLEILGKIALARRQYRRATLLLAATTTACSEAFLEISTDEPSYNQMLAAIQAQLDEETFESLWKEGCALTAREALRVAACEPVQEEMVKIKQIQMPAQLTPREVEVLGLMSQGFTNPQIAHRLTISPVTVNAHVRSIYNKLEVNTRSKATRYALEHHLV